MNTFCGICGSFTTVSVSGRCNKCDGAVWEGADPFFVSGPAGVRTERTIIPAGEVLADRFRVVKFLGSGRSSVLYLCQDVLSRERVALKVAESTDDESAVLHLMRERQVHCQVREYAHILRSMDLHSCNWNGRHLIFLSSEFADGGTFREWLDKHSGDVHARSSRGLHWLKDTLRGLCSLHRMGIVHLDLSPENILLASGAAKVGDLGACILSDRRFIESVKLPTSAPADWGTPEYMSPEQFRARDVTEVDARSNVYSVGVILYELLHPQCRRPFDGTSNRLRECHQTTPPAPLPQSPDSLHQIVMRCLEKNPQARYSSVDELLGALESKVTAGDGASSESTQSDPSSSKSQTIADELWRRCTEAHDIGHLDDALKLCKMVVAQFPDHPEAGELLSELERRYNQTTATYEAIRRDIGLKNAKELIKILPESQEFFNHPLRLLVLKELEHTITKAQKWQNDAATACERGNHSEALNLYQLAHRINPNPIVELAIELCNRLSESDLRVQALRDSVDPGWR